MGGSVIVELATVPVEVRAEAAWNLIVDGVDPYVALHHALWPNARVHVPTDDLVVRFCRNGHALTRENTYVVPSRGWRRCLDCKRETDLRSKRGTKQPCAYCGEPATPTYNKIGRSRTIVRCRNCYREGRGS